MKLIKKTKKSYILRLDPGEEFLSSIQDFCEENEIKNGWLEAIGSTKELELAYFNLDKKDYDTSVFVEFLEILSITGNIAMRDRTSSASQTPEGLSLKKPFCHAHGVFGRPDFSPIGGHIMRCVISATCEVILRVGEGEMKREFDDETSLYLLK